MLYFASHLKHYTFLILLFVANADSSVRVFSSLNPSDKAPDLILPKLDTPAENIDLQKLNRPAILIFGEPYHQQTLKSLVELKKTYDALDITETNLPPFMVVSQIPNQDQLTQLRGKEMVCVEILLDRNLKAFGDYGVTVLPSIVVIDKRGRIDLALSGVPLSFSDMMGDAILLATERITPQQFTSFRSAMQATGVQQESVKQAHRLAHLAGQLASRNYTKIALQRYYEALELDHAYAEARIGAARCLIKLNLLPDAVKELKKILQTNADHVEANLVMSQIEIIQGGDGITEGKKRLERILTVNPDHPEANYLMGMVCEAQSQTEQALKYYKKAAKRLLEI